jgi:hypothetical protein
MSIFLKDDIKWLVLKLEISYNRVIIINILKDFGFFILRGFFLKIMFVVYWWKYLSFHHSSFALRYLLM